MFYYSRPLTSALLQVPETRNAMLCLLDDFEARFSFSNLRQTGRSLLASLRIPAHFITPPMVVASGVLGSMHK